MNTKNKQDEAKQTRLDMKRADHGGSRHHQTTGAPAMKEITSEIVARSLRSHWAMAEDKTLKWTSVMDQIDAISNLLIYAGITGEVYEDTLFLWEIALLRA